MPDFVWLMIILGAVAVTAVLFWFLGTSNNKKKTEETIGKAEDKARSAPRGQGRVHSYEE